MRNLEQGSRIKPCPKCGSVERESGEFRASGGGGYKPAMPEDIVMRTTAPLHDSMIKILRTCAPLPWQDVPPWRFAPLGGIDAQIRTHPDAMAMLGDIAHLSPQIKGTTPQGFIQLLVTL